jgi:hypothetical protein
MITLDLKKIEKRKVQINLEKYNRGLSSILMEVNLILDKSGSISNLYKNGKIQELLERIVPMALSFDTNQELGLYLFDDSVSQSKLTVTLNNLENFVQNNLSNISFGGTNYSPAIHKVMNDNFTKSTRTLTKTRKVKSGGLFGFGGSEKLETYTVNEIAYEPNLNKIPVFNIFITDGDNWDKAETIKAIEQASYAGAFFVFVGIGDMGCTEFPFLEKLDDLEGRFVDNANYFSVQNLQNMSDQELYSKLLDEVPQWITTCKQKGILA